MTLTSVLGRLSSLVLVLSVCVVLLAASKSSPPEFELRGFQLSSGLIQTFKNGNSADPYFGLYALAAAQRGGLSVASAQAKFIAWGLGAQLPDGRFTKYCAINKVWGSCGTSDSDDATLARWVHLLYSAAPVDAPLPTPWAQSAALSEAALFELRLPSGIYSVFKHGTPGYEGYALFKDNVEVLSVFEQLASLFQVRGNSVKAAQYTESASKLRIAMGEQFGSDPFNMHRFAVGANYPGWLFYPHSVAIPFGWKEGYFPPPTSSQWDLWLKRYYQDWLSNAKTDFPWGMVAVSALATGPASEAACWLQRTASQRVTQYRWNVLEEASAQIIERQGPPLSQCRPGELPQLRGTSPV